MLGALLLRRKRPLSFPPALLVLPVFMGVVVVVTGAVVTGVAVVMGAGAIGLRVEVEVVEVATISELIRSWVEKSELR